MNYEAVKCPNCGAQLQIDDSLESGFCTYCGSKLIIKGSIQRAKIEVSGHISVAGLSTVENDILLGQNCLIEEEWQSAENYFKKALTKDATNFHAWFGCLTAITRDFSYVYLEPSMFSGVYGVDSAMRNCLIYGNAEQRSMVQRKVSHLLTIIQLEDEKEYQNGLQCYKRSNKQAVIGFSLLVISFISLIIFIANFNDLSKFGILGLLIAISLLGLSLVLITSNADSLKEKNDKDFHNEKITSSIKMLKHILEIAKSK